MNRDEVVKLATRASYGVSDEELETLDQEVRAAAARTGRSVGQTADLLRKEAFAGDWYRGETFDA
jgi:hypothetical protein